jgi:hypothetical protein
MPPSFFATRWPGPGGVDDVAVLFAVLAGALGFAIFLPLGRTGIGWSLSGLVAAAGVAVAARRGGATLPRGERLIRAGWGASALALLSVLAFRNAWWLVTFCVLGALGCAALAIAGGRSIRSILFSIVAAPFASVRGLRWVGRHGDLLRHSAIRPGASKRLTWSLVVTVALVLLFGSLFSSADAAFAKVLDNYLPSLDAGKIITWVFLFLVGTLVTVAGVFLVSAPPDLSAMDTPGRRRLGAAEWILPISALVALFAGFVAVQVTVLFGGRDHVLSTAGLNYAEYARSGFWQLIAVTVLTLLVVSAMGRWGARETTRQRTLMRVLLGALCGLTLVIVASALFRMYTYQQMYSFTGERIFVMAFELLLGVFFILVMLAGIRWQGAWVPRVGVGLTVVMLLSLAVMNPEAYAARRNIERFHEVGKIDPWYLRALSADATPVLATLPEDLRQCTLQWILRKLAEDDPWYAWNLGRQRARVVLAELGPSAVSTVRNPCAIGTKYDFPKEHR